MWMIWFLNSQLFIKNKACRKVVVPVKGTATFCMNYELGVSKTLRDLAGLLRLSGERNRIEVFKSGDD